MRSEEYKSDEHFSLLRGDMHITQVKFIVQVPELSLIRWGYCQFLDQYCKTFLL
jgi:hypothetical protein